MKRAVMTVAILAAGLVQAAPAMAGDAALGKTVFAAQCAMCHTVTKGGPTIMGPNLFGLVGRKSGSVANFAYSKSMKALGVTWTEDKLRAYLPAPATMVPGTKMAFGGIKNPAQLDNLVAYLVSLK